MASWDPRRPAARSIFKSKNNRRNIPLFKLSFEIKGTFDRPYSGTGIHSMMTRNPSYLRGFWSYWSIKSLLNSHVFLLKCFPKLTKKEKSNGYSAYSYSEYSQSKTTLDTISNGLTSICLTVSLETK